MSRNNNPPAYYAEREPLMPSSSNIVTTIRCSTSVPHRRLRPRKFRKTHNYKWKKHGGGAFKRVCQCADLKALFIALFDALAGEDIWLAVNVSRSVCL